MPDLTLIADVARTGAIGDGETIPWHYDADEQQYSDRALVSEMPEQATGSRVVPYLGTNWSVVDRHESDEFEVVEYRNDDPLS